MGKCASRHHFFILGRMCHVSQGMVYLFPSRFEAVFFHFELRGITKHQPRETKLAVSIGARHVILHSSFFILQNVDIESIKIPRKT